MHGKRDSCVGGMAVCSFRDSYKGTGEGSPQKIRRLPYQKRFYIFPIRKQKSDIYNHYNLSPAPHQDKKKRKGCKEGASMGNHKKKQVPFISLLQKSG